MVGKQIKLNKVKLMELINSEKNPKESEGLVFERFFQ